MVAIEEEEPSSDSLQITASMLAAQEIAEQLANEAEEQHQRDIETIICQTEVIPQFLQIVPGTDMSKLARKTNELKSKGQQLDLLLLKAETYSHFIRENQERSRKHFESRHIQILESPTAISGKKRKATSDESVAAMSPSLVGGTLMPYQVEGIKWLLSLWENGLSGILGDEMGLGKTIQVIGLIAMLKDLGSSGPFLIAAPLCTLPNWINEFKKWLPSLPVILYHGTKEERAQICHRMSCGSVHVVVTSFEICMIDRPQLAKWQWQYLIIDEGHRIKNRNCRLLRELKQIPSVSRLLLSGTPIQNTLDELWSLLNFVNPMIFDNLEVFQAWFGFKNIGRDIHVSDILQDEQRNRIVSKLHEILRPFLLRRMKKDVLVAMPGKREIVVYAVMTALQREYYAHVQNHTLHEALAAVHIEMKGESKTSQKNMLMNLRKVCNHPFIFGEPKDEHGAYIGEASPEFLVRASGKLKLLDRMLRVLHSRGHKVLIFSQMTAVLDILQDYLAYRNYSCVRIDGQVKMKERQEAIDQYNKDPDLFCFLLSTRAGGLGINLTAADTCILYDSDYNPHADAQAQDRCHRIGQSRNVMVYRLLTAGTMEIQMLERQISKRKLDRMTIRGGDFGKAGKRGGEFTLDRLKDLLEDDVKNLGRMSVDPKMQKRIVVDDSSNEASSVICDISEEDLLMIMDRDRLFSKDCNIPVEGRMYDVIPAEDGPLQGVHW